MSDTTIAQKKRTITLTGRAPVRIVEDEWPIIAIAGGSSFTGRDENLAVQAISDEIVDQYFLRVRRGQDGRLLVYGVLEAAAPEYGAPAEGDSHRGGELLPSGADVAAAIQRVGESCRLPEAIIRQCVANLPAEDL